MTDELNTTTPAENSNDAGTPSVQNPAPSAPAQTQPSDKTAAPATNPPATLLDSAVNKGPEDGAKESSDQQDGQGKTAEEGEAPEGDKKDGADKPSDEGAPEKYEAFKAPEGVRLDDAVMNQFGEVAKKLNLSQEKAQGVIDELAPLMAQRQVETIQNVSREWAEKSKACPEIADHLSDIARLRDKFAYDSNGKIDPDIAEFMSSPAGNHPGVLKLLARAGKAFGEAGFPRGNAGGKETFTASDIYHSR